jgi:hypothetical protein
VGFLASLIGSFFTSALNAVVSWFSGRQQRADEQTLGQKTQAVADEQQQVVQATANETRVADVVQAENASLVKSAADPSSLRDADPDSRD